MRNLLIISLFFSLLVNIGPVNAGILNDDKTGIKMSNDIYTNLDQYEADLNYDIITPKVLHYDFVLALDSSGSLDDSKVQCDAVVEAVPEFLGEVPMQYPEAYFNISIISWDNDIDFAYDKINRYTVINKNEPLKTNLASIEQIINDSGNFKDEFHCEETETTDLSVPIKASLDILNLEANHNSPNYFYYTKRFVILVTGNGEFSRCNPDLIKAINKNGYEVYAIGMDIGINSEMEDQLLEIAGKKDRYKPITSGWDFIEGNHVRKALNDSLYNALKESLIQAVNGPVAYNAKISDRLLCYYKINPYTFVINGNPEDAKFVSSKELGDGTSEIELKIPDKYLLPNKEVKVSIKAENTFRPGELPVTVAESKGPIIICSPTKRPNQPAFSYTWFNGIAREKAMEKPTRKAPAQILRTQSARSKIDPMKTNFVLTNLLRFLSIFKYGAN